jgi:hypothetical protein
MLLLVWHTEVSNASHKRTSADEIGMSDLGQKQTSGKPYCARFIRKLIRQSSMYLPVKGYNQRRAKL